MSDKLDLKIVTGMSGAGKTQVINVLEDMGYFCIDNLPPNLFGKIAELANQNLGELKQIALVADVRGRRFFSDLIEVIGKLRSSGAQIEVIFLEASNNVLVRRFKETRRKHPLAAAGSVLLGIEEERKLLEGVRGIADVVIDTSALTPRQLKEDIVKLAGREGGPRLAVSIFSFGFKYGMPIDADLVMDVRFLPNPYYVPELRTLTGNDALVRDFVLGHEVTKKFLDKFSGLITDLLPCYIVEGKRHLSVAIGCTGGQHRSVTVANELVRRLEPLTEPGGPLAGITVSGSHRDVERARVDTKYKPIDD